MVTNVIVGICMRQNFQFMKVDILNINRKAVTTFLIKKTICDTPMTSPSVASDV